MQDYLTPLHVAAHCGNVRTAKLLLDRKCEVNARALVRPVHCVSETSWVTGDSLFCLVSNESPFMSDLKYLGQFVIKIEIKIMKIIQVSYFCKYFSMIYLRYIPFTLCFDIWYCYSQKITQSDFIHDYVCVYKELLSRCVAIRYISWPVNLLYWYFLSLQCFVKTSFVFWQFTEWIHSTPHCLQEKSYQGCGTFVEIWRFHWSHHRGIDSISFYCISLYLFDKAFVFW